MAKVPRRHVVKGIAAVAASSALAAVPQFPFDQGPVLEALASVVLPREIAPKAAAERFANWVRGYKPDAEMEHGYGFPKLSSRPPSPADKYVAQLRALAAKGIVTMKPAERRAVVESTLAEAVIKSLPRLPACQNVIADFMSFYFFSSEATDACYGVAIRSAACRGFRNVGNVPEKLA